MSELMDQGRAHMHRVKELQREVDELKATISESESDAVIRIMSDFAASIPHIKHKAIMEASEAVTFSNYEGSDMIWPSQLEDYADNLLTQAQEHAQ